MHARVADSNALEPSPPALPTYPKRRSLIYSPRAWFQLVRAFGARITREHLEWNYNSVAPHIREGDRVLDVGAWDCSLLQELQKRKPDSPNLNDSSQCSPCP